MAPQLIEKDGVSIYVYGRDHVPPHVHAFSGDDEALVNIRTGEIFAGNISSKQLKVVQTWLNEGENRKLAEQNFYELNPRLQTAIDKKDNTKKPIKKGHKKDGN